MEIDLAQAEWVVTAYYAREMRMIETLEKGLDPHVETGCLISGAPRDVVIADDRLVGHQTDPEFILDLRKDLPKGPWFLPRSMSIRQAGKKGNHGLNYDEGYKTFALQNEIDEVEAKIIVEKYHNGYPGLRQMYSSIKEQLRRDMTLTNCLGSKRVFRLAWGQVLLKAAYAQIPQSTVGDVGKIGLRRIYEDEWLRHYDRCVTMGNVHDSIPNSVRFDSIEELAEIMSRCCQHLTVPLEYHNRTFTLKTDVKVGKNWGEMHTVSITDNPIEGLRGVLDQLGIAPVAQ